LNGYTNTRNHRNKPRETRKKQQSTETKRIVNTKTQARYGPGIYV